MWKGVQLLVLVGFLLTDLAGSVEEEEEEDSPDRDEVRQFNSP